MGDSTADSVDDPSAFSPEHIRENFDVFDFELDDEEVRDVFELQGGLPADLADRLGVWRLGDRERFGIQ